MHACTHTHTEQQIKQGRSLLIGKHGGQLRAPGHTPGPTRAHTHCLASQRRTHARTPHSKAVAGGGKASADSNFGIETAGKQKGTAWVGELAAGAAGAHRLRGGGPGTAASEAGGPGGAAVSASSVGEEPLWSDPGDRRGGWSQSAPLPRLPRLPCWSPSFLWRETPLNGVLDTGCPQKAHSSHRFGYLAWRAGAGGGEGGGGVAGWPPLGNDLCYAPPTPQSCSQGPTPLSDLTNH